MITVDKGAGTINEETNTMKLEYQLIKIKTIYSGISGDQVMRSNTLTTTAITITIISLLHYYYVFKLTRVRVITWKKTVRLSETKISL